MEPVKPLSPHGRAMLAGYRDRTPRPARAQHNWAAVQRKLQSPVDRAREQTAPAGSPWRRTVTAALTSVAAAAAVLLLVRGTFAGVRALTRDEASPRSQAADSQPNGTNTGAWSRGGVRAPSGTAAVSTATDSQPPQTQPLTPPHANQTIDTPQAPRVRVPPPSPRDPDPSLPSSNAGATLAEQTRQLAEARDALAAKRFGDALRLSQAYRRQFPTGALLEETMAIEAIARCSVDREPASADAFMAMYPASPHAQRVRTACEH